MSGVFREGGGFEGRGGGGLLFIRPCPDTISVFIMDCEIVLASDVNSFDACWRSKTLAKSDITPRTSPPLSKSFENDIGVCIVTRGDCGGDDWFPTKGGCGGADCIIIGACGRACAGACTTIGGEGGGGCGCIMLGIGDGGGGGGARGGGEGAGGGGDGGGGSGGPGEDGGTEGGSGAAGGAGCGGSVCDDCKLIGTGVVNNCCWGDGAITGEGNCDWGVCGSFVDAVWVASVGIDCVLAVAGLVLLLSCPNYF